MKKENQIKQYINNFRRNETNIYKISEDNNKTETKRCSLCKDIAKLSITIRKNQLFLCLRCYDILIIGLNEFKLIKTIKNYNKL